MTDSAPDDGHINSAIYQSDMPLPVQTGQQVAFAHLVQSGPLPPADELKKYGPEVVAWILVEAKASAEHAREMERRGIQIAGRDAQLHRWLPFAVIMFFASAFLAIGLKFNGWIGSAGVAAAFGTAARAYFKNSGKSNHN